ncbi:MAG: hypothetical protein J2P46_06690 [Zavarzinella sp.]|nr:hypothetical protein [Zavarzinella sp.]
MPGESEALRDWHRLFGLLLTDYFTGSPFEVEVERDLSVQQQFLDVVIIRRRPGRFAGRLPDGLEGLRAHNLVTFKSHREALDSWAMKELIGHSVAYRKLVSPSPSELIPEDQFGLYAVAARHPDRLSAQVPWERVGPGVYDCRWGTDTVRLVVAGELPREAHNAPLHLFSARPALVGFGGRAYGHHSGRTSRLLMQLFEGLAGEGVAMPFTMEDFDRQFAREHFRRLSPEEQQVALQTLTPEGRQRMLQALPPEERQEMLQALPPEERLAGLSAEQIRQYLDRMSGGRRTPARKPRRKK